MLSILAGPFDPEIAVALESRQQPDLGDVPWNAPNEDFARVDGVAIDSWRKNSTPGAGCYSGWTTDKHFAGYINKISKSYEYKNNLVY